ncbi:alpha-N-arabinofuranosidase [Haloferax sp. DFSO52]|uniref:alpha-N-arabinofuranosidase n=1 Tax=Haloferax sp. DFSO52 TaxID=3388505 RepID=UPI003A83EC7A
MDSELFIRRHDPIDQISPDIYGHFAEHLGRCIYGGVWVGDDGQVETNDGIREDTVSLLRELDMPVLRWPGGCFADDYHWEDGVGAREDRPQRRNLHWAQGREEVFEESNDFGTDEFVRLCESLGTEPYFAANVGTGSPDEATNWVEYCNYDGDTELANRRRENDQTGNGEDGYDVRFWGVGNENWGCGGRFSPEEYAKEFRRYANYLRTYDRTMSNTDLELIAVGHINDDWNRRFLDQLEQGIDWVDGSPHNLMDHLAVHRYYKAGGETEFTEEQYYKLFARARKVAADVDDAIEALDVFAPHADIGVIVDEWGVWHPEAVSDNGLEQENTVRDAVSAAGVLDDLNARADVVTMANIAQTVNVLQCLVQTNESEAWTTPTYHVFDLYKKHMGGTALRTVVDTDVLEIEDEEFDVPMVSASASESDGNVFATVSNRDLNESRTVRVDTDMDELSTVEAEVLFEDLEADEFSSPDNADDFAADTLEVEEIEDGICVVELPPNTVASITLSE